MTYRALLMGRQSQAHRAARLIEQVQAAAAAHHAPFLERSWKLVARST
jgi:hypothetical protein